MRMMIASTAALALPEGALRLQGCSVSCSACNRHQNMVLGVEVYMPGSANYIASWMQLPLLPHNGQIAGQKARWT